MLLHGISNISGGVAPVADVLAQHGLPSGFAYGAYIGEVLAPVLVIVVGLWTCPAALVVAVTMGVAMPSAHSDQIWRSTMKVAGLSSRKACIYLVPLLSR